MINFDNLGIYINGEWIRNNREMFSVYNKFSGESVAKLPLATKEDVILAGNAATNYFEQNSMTPNDIYLFLTKVASKMKEEADSLAEELVIEVGKTIKEARAEVNSAVAAFIDAGEEAKRVTGETIPVDANPGSENRFAFTLYTPSGPVCAFTPFNAPLNQAAHKIASSIAAGSSVVLKTNPYTPLTAVHLVDIMHKIGMPKGLVNLVLGDADVGKWLVEDESYSHFTFTGSPQVGIELRANSSGRPVTLELGSNAHTIVHSDADLNDAASAILASGFAIAGQVCTSVQRALIHEDIIDQFTEILVAKVNKMIVGDPMDINTDMGPMLTEEAA